jgi:hypothetical protein
VSENSVLFHKTGYQFKRFAQFYSDKTSFDFMKNMSNSEGTANQGKPKTGVETTVRGLI